MDWKVARVSLSETGWRGAGFVKIFEPEGASGWDRKEKKGLHQITPIVKILL